MAINLFGDISPRTAAYVIPQLLKRGMNYLNLEKFGQSQPLPERSTMSMKFRRYESLALATTPLTEGVTPSSKKLTKTDVTMTLAQYGDLVEISDVIADTHEDPVFQEAQNVIGEQAAETVETIRYGKLKACSNKFYANGTARTAVNTQITLAKQRKITRALKRQKARMITSIIRSTENFNTENVPPAFVCVCHTDCETDIRGMTGFIDVKDYGQLSPYENEVGSVESVRYLISNIYTAYADAGAAKAGSGTTMISTSGTNADVYPYIFLGRDSYAISALKGKYSITPIVINPTPSKSDPLGQRGSVAWKTMQGCEILNDLWMAVLEAAVVELS
jgi:N4-gp56 family major capsid protein